MTTKAADSWQTINACEHWLSDPASAWGSFLVSDRQLQTAAQLAAAIALHMGAIDQGSVDSWACLVRSAEAPAVCDLPIAAEQCQEHLAAWWRCIDAVPADDPAHLIPHYGYCNTLLGMLRTEAPTIFHKAQQVQWLGEELARDYVNEAYD